MMTNPEAEMRIGTNENRQALIWRCLQYIKINNLSELKFCFLFLKKKPFLEISVSKIKGTLLKNFSNFTVKPEDLSNIPRL